MSLNECRPGQQPRSRLLLFCNKSRHSVSRLWRQKKNNGGRETIFATISISQVAQQRSEVSEIEENGFKTSMTARYLHYSD